MSNSKEFSGVWTAIVTPFTESGDIDFASFDKLVSSQMKAGIDGLVIAGTTGESPTLTVDEKLRLVTKAKEIVGSNMRIMAGSGCNNTQNTVDLSKKMEAAGADSLLVVTPPYNKPSIGGLVAHFRAVTDATTVPICLYHVPGRTGQLLSSDALSKLTENLQIKGIKEASGCLNLFQEVRLKCREGLSLLTGDDPTYLASRCIGGDGVISVITNLYPTAMVKMDELVVQNKISTAQEINLSLFPAMQAMFLEPNPTPIKAMLSEKGLCKNNFRLPLTPATNESVERISFACHQAQSRLENMGVLV